MSDYSTTIMPHEDMDQHTITKTPQFANSYQRDIESTPYCTHKCLLGLAKGGCVDLDCPNAWAHGEEHLDLAAFLEDMDKEANSTDVCQETFSPVIYHPMGRAGQTAALYKIHHKVRGYTLVAKGVHYVDRPKLIQEEATYQRLVSLQGKHIPVCLGVVDLAIPLIEEDYIDNHLHTFPYRHFLLMSFAGFALNHTSAVDEATILEQLDAAFKAIHALGVLHRDATAHNVVCDGNGEVKVIDFEHAEWYDPADLRGDDDENMVLLDCMDERAMIKWRIEDYQKGQIRSSSKWTYNQAPVTTWEDYQHSPDLCW